MQHPVIAQRAYILLGLLLGTFPPAALFLRFFNYGFEGSDEYDLLALCVAMNITCALAGAAMGAKLTNSMIEIEERDWLKMLLSASLTGALWAALTGAAGGAVFFIIGTFFGAFCALPVGVLGFLLFAALHRVMSHNGIIEAKHLWPLACGITGLIVALILGFVPQVL